MQLREHTGLLRGTKGTPPPPTRAQRENWAVNSDAATTVTTTAAALGEPRHDAAAPDVRRERMGTAKVRVAGDAEKARTGRRG